ncbi:MAG: DUF4097 family beta strand repeat-containing protein [Desulfobacterales bacterium]
MMFRCFSKNWTQLLGIGIFMVGQPAFASQETLERTFEVSPGGELAIRSDRGSIEIISGEDSEVRIEVIPRGDLQDVADIEDEFDVHFDQSGNRVSLDIESHRRGIFRWFGWNRAKLHIRARVPSQFSVDLKTSGGSISVEDLKGEARAATSGGGLSFGRIEGTVWGRTSGGSVRLSESSGDADVRTSGGSIILGEVGGTIVARTSGGSITVDRAVGSVVVSTSGGRITLNEVLGSIEARTSGGSVSANISRQPEGNCYLKTSGGSITVRLASNLGFNINARTSGGRVKSDFAIRGGTRKKIQLTGELNAGGPELMLRTSGGSIRILDMP